MEINVLVIAGMSVVPMSSMSQAQADNYLLNSLCPDLLKIPLEALPDVEIRKEFVEQITEEYFEQFDEFPKHVPLSMLGDFLLLDYIKDAGKSKDDELQFLTHSQSKRRKEKEFSAITEDIDFFECRDVKKMDSLKRKAPVAYDND